MSPNVRALRRAGLVVLLAGQLAFVDWALHPSSTARTASSSTSAGANSSAGPSGSLSVAGSAGSGSGHTPFSVNGRGHRQNGKGTSANAAALGISGPFGTSGSSASGAGNGSGTTTAGAGAASSPVAAAQEALGSYMSGLVNRDSQKVAAVSDDGPLAVAAILLDSAAINDGRGATTTMTASPVSFTASQASSSSVVLSGSVTLTTAIAGPAGSGTFTDTISGPVTVTHEASGWRVTDYRYDSQPVQLWPEEQTQTVNGVVVNLGFVVSYGDVTAALIGLGAESGSADVQLQAVTLTAGATSESGVGDFTGPPTPTGVLRFSRAPATPGSLAIDFSSSSGQRYDYTFALS